MFSLESLNWHQGKIRKKRKEIFFSFFLGIRASLSL